MDPTSSLSSAFLPLSFKEDGLAQDKIRQKIRNPNNKFDQTDFTEN